MKPWWAAIIALGAPLLLTAEPAMDRATREKALLVLHTGLHGDAFWPAMHAAEALTIAGQGREVRRTLLPRLDVETDDQRRCGLAREMVRAGDHQRAVVLFAILDSPSPYGHVHAAESLFKVGWRGSGTQLWTAFQQVENPRLRLMAAAALARHGHDREQAAALEYLRRHLATAADPDLFRLSAWVLGRVGSAADIDLLRSRLGDATDPRHLAMLHHAMAALGDRYGQSQLMDNLTSTDPWIRTAAATFAGEIGLSEAVPQLISQLYDEHDDARIRAAQALFTIEKLTSEKSS